MQSLKNNSLCLIVKRLPFVVFVFFLGAIMIARRSFTVNMCECLFFRRRRRRFYYRTINN